MKYAVVQGRGSFPVDMLRYDSCYPNSERDSSLIEGTLRDYMSKNRPERWSICIRSAGENPWTVGRWESFGCKIHDIPREMTFDRACYISYRDEELAS